LERHGVGEALINTHYLAQSVENYVSQRRGKIAIHLSHERVLAGSAGTIARNWDFVSSEEHFFVCNADNLTNLDLSTLLSFHKTADALLTLALFEASSPRDCGIVETDERGLVKSFVEKPAAPRSNLANGGVYVMSREIESLLPTHEPADIAFDLIPKCLDGTYGWRWDGLLLDVGSPAAYAAAQHAIDK
jgi:mannose-1-phosphate guanylyltransferase